VEELVVQVAGPQAGFCKNISRIWECEYEDEYSALTRRFGSKKERDGYCNCNRCPESNVTYVDPQTLQC
jgi:hypothetical protein